MTVSYRVIFDAIKAKRFERLYLFHGPEEYIKAEALRQLKAALIPEDFGDLNYQLMDGSQVDGEDIIASCETLPFMGDRRMVVVKDYGGLGKKAVNEDVLKEYLGRIPDSSCLVFYCRGDVDKGRQLYKALKKQGTAVPFDRLKDAELHKWAAAAFKKSHKEIRPAELNHFLFLVGNRLEDIYNEIQKLAAYSGDAPLITREAIDTVATPLPEHTVFQLLDAVSGRNSGQALLLLDELMGGGQAILGIITLLARQIKTMLLCKQYMAKGYVQDQIAARLKVHPYMVKKCMSQCRNFTPNQLRASLDQCLSLDYAIKNGKLKDRLGIELLIIKMCG